MLIWTRRGYSDGSYATCERMNPNDCIHNFTFTVYGKDGTIIRKRLIQGIAYLPAWAKRDFMEDMEANR